MSKLILCLSLILSLQAFASDKRAALSDTDKKQITKAFKSYESLFKSFFIYNPRKIDKKLEKFVTDLKQVKHKAIQSELKKNKVYELLSKVKAKGDRDENNMNHSVASKHIYDVIIAKYDLGAGWDLYYCPMIKKYWFQNSKDMKKVHNPYAPEMPHCGARKTYHK